MATKGKGSTAGPWIIQNPANGHELHIHNNDRMGVIATVNLSRGGLTPDGRANARLIAAAPELMAALREAERLLTAFAEGSGPHGSVLLLARQTNRALLARLDEANSGPDSNAG